MMRSISIREIAIVQFRCDASECPIEVSSVVEAGWRSLMPLYRKLFEFIVPQGQNPLDLVIPVIMRFVHRS